MRVKDVMTRHATACSLDSNLAGVASRMFLGDCGAIPVLDRGGRVVGILTDRDICLALAAKDRPASEVRARDVISGRIYTCRPDDDVRDALKTMREKHVRRLPVVDEKGKLKGIISVTDAVRHARQLPLDEDLAGEDVLGTLRSVSVGPKESPDEAELHA